MLHGAGRGWENTSARRILGEDATTPTVFIGDKGGEPFRRSERSGVAIDNLATNERTLRRYIATASPRWVPCDLLVPLLGSGVGEAKPILRWQGEITSTSRGKKRCFFLWTMNPGGERLLTP